jgi:nicotinamide phosphoribosyltransferase
LTLLRNRLTGEYRTVTLPVAGEKQVHKGDKDEQHQRGEESRQNEHSEPSEWEDALVTVFDSGRLLVDVSLAEIRSRAHAGEL